MLLGVVGCALVFTLLSFGLNGSRWAIAIGLSLVSLAMTFLVFGLLHVATTFCQIIFSGSRGRQRTAGESPFAESRRPPQLLRPDEPD